MSTAPCGNPDVEQHTYGSVFVTVYGEDAFNIVNEELVLNESAVEIVERQLFPLATGLTLPKYLADRPGHRGMYWLLFQLYNEGGQLVEEYWDKLFVKCEQDRVFTIEIDYRHDDIDKRYTFKDDLEYIETDLDDEGNPLYPTIADKIEAVNQERFFQRFGRDIVRLSHDGTEEYFLNRRTLLTNFPLSLDGTHRPNANALQEASRVGGNMKFGNIMMKWPKFYYKFTPRDPIRRGEDVRLPCPTYPAPWEYKEDTRECCPPDVPEPNLAYFMMAAGGGNAGEGHTGGGHTVVVMDGELWTCGDNLFGQLCRTTGNRRYNDQFVKVVDGRFPYSHWKVVDVSCGAEHTVFIVENKDTAQRRIFGCGRNDLGQLLIPPNSGANSLFEIQVPAGGRTNIRPVKVECGISHTHLIFETGPTGQIRQDGQPRRTTELYNGGLNAMGELCRGTIFDGEAAWVTLPDREMVTLQNVRVDAAIFDDDPDVCVVEFRGRIANLAQAITRGLIQTSSGVPRFSMTRPDNSYIFFPSSRGALDASGTGEFWCTLNIPRENLPQEHRFTFNTFGTDNSYDSSFHYLDFRVSLVNNSPTVTYRRNEPVDKKQYPYDISNKYYSSALITSRLEPRRVPIRECGKEECPDGFKCHNGVCICGETEYDEWKELLPGKVWTAGTNHYGQLGRVSERFYDETLVELAGQRNKVKYARTGWGTTALVRENKELWTCGANYFGQLGISKAVGRHNRPNLTNNGVFVNDIQFGAWHMLYRDADNRVWTAGIGENHGWAISNHYNVLLATVNIRGREGGHGTETMDYTNLQAVSFRGEAGAYPVHAYVICAAYQFSGLISTMRKTIWTAGDNEHGQLGRANTVLDHGVIDKRPDVEPIAIWERDNLEETWPRDCIPAEWVPTWIHPPNVIRISLAWRPPDGEEDEWKTFHVLDGREVRNLYTSLFAAHVSTRTSRSPMAFSLHIPNNPATPGDNRFTEELPRAAQVAVRNIGRRYQPLTWDIFTMMRIMRTFVTRGQSEDISEYFNVGVPIHQDLPQPPFKPMFLDGIKPIKMPNTTVVDEKEVEVEVRDFEIYLADAYAIIPTTPPITLARSDFQTYRRAYEGVPDDPLVYKSMEEVEWASDVWGTMDLQLLPRHFYLGTPVNPRLGLDFRPVVRETRNDAGVVTRTENLDTEILKLDRQNGVYVLRQTDPALRLPFYFTAFGVADGQEVAISSRYDIEPTYMRIEND